MNANRTVSEEASASAAAPQPPARSRLRDLATRLAVDGGVVVFLLLLIVAFSVFLPSTFPTTSNLQLVLGSHNYHDTTGTLPPMSDNSCSDN